MFKEFIQGSNIENSKLLFFFLGLSLLIIPFVDNFTVRLMITILVIDLFINGMVIFIRYAKYVYKRR